MKKVVVKILQGSVVTETILGGLTIYPQVANFLKCICAKKYANWLVADKVIAKISRLTFLAHPVYWPTLCTVTEKKNTHADFFYMSSLNIDWSIFNFS